MRRRRPASLAALLLAVLTTGCATDPGVVERPVGVADMPMVFDYGGLDPARGRYRQILAGDGAVAYELVLTEPEAIALFGYYTIAADADATPGSLHHEAESVFGEDRPSWGEGGTIRLDGAATDYQLFEVEARKLHCIALQRNARDHDAAPAGRARQTQARGFYCRSQPPLTTDEAPAIAAALRLR